MSKKKIPGSMEPIDRKGIHLGIVRRGAVVETFVLHWTQSKSEVKHSSHPEEVTDWVSEKS